MKILFVYPPRNNKALAPANFEPLALEILASTVKSHGIEILDLRFESTAKLEKKVFEYKPHVVGISVNNTIQVNQSKNVLKHIKTLHPQVINVVGGHHPTLAPEDFYNSYVDAIFLGWAEKNFPTYISYLESKIDKEVLTGIILLQNGHSIYKNKQTTKLSTNDIPIPDRSITAKYQNHYKNELGQKFALVNTARGCPYRCSFCACWKASNGQYLVRNAADVFNELVDIPKDIKHIFFADDNTFSDVKRADELFHLIKSSTIDKKYTGYCRSDIIVRNPALFEKWKEIGLENLTIGFESIDNNKLQEYGKKNRVETNQQAAQILNDLNIPFTSYFLIDPNFNKNDFQNVLNYVNNHNLIRPRFVVLTPLPGTKLYERYKNKINLDYDFFDFMHWVHPTKLKQTEFFNNIASLYYKTYSFQRYFKTVLHNILIRLKKLKSPAKGLKHISFFELVLLRIMAFPLRRKLYKHYFRASL